MGVKWEDAAAATATDLRLRPRRLFVMNPARLGWLGRNGSPRASLEKPWTRAQSRSTYEEVPLRFKVVKSSWLRGQPAGTDFPTGTDSGKEIQQKDINHLFLQRRWYCS